MAQEKLIVKNFGPIKEAELELGKVTVFIGEQASGKSVLAKLVAICKMINVISLPEEKYFTDSNIFNFINEHSFVKFTSKNYEWLYSKDGMKLDIKNSHFKDLLDLYTKIYTQIKGPITIDSSNEQKLNFQLLLKELNNIGQEIISINSYPNYIPTERILISLISNSLFTFNKENISLPVYLTDFGSRFERARLSLKKLNIPILDISFSFRGNRTKINLPNGERVDLTEASSGFQSLIPMIFVIEETSERNNQLFIIEEPELNLYPTTQKKLVEYLAGKTDKNSLILTTHSPYILSSLDNLIQAGNVVKKHPELKDEVEKIIPAKYHLNYEDVKVYFVADGTARLIMNEELQSIDVSELDVVSEDLNADFEKLLDLKYQH